ncbi:MAG: IS1595 family transposase [Pseudomonadota bacterium]|nr:IS1595 family transposase [Pseudomonadota bacterium]
MEPRKFTQFVAQLATLSTRQRMAIAQLLPLASRQENTAALIEAARAPRLACPRCSSVRLLRNGHAHGLQRYRCADCARSFNALTGTPLARLRHRGKWLPYLDSMLASHTVRGAAALVGVHKNTSFRWRHRFLAWAKNDRTLPLGGITEADETYLLESQKGSRRLDRPARRRGGVASRRGISREHMCILVARDRTGRTVDFVTGRAPLTRAQLHRCLPTVVAPDIVLVTDGHPAYPWFAREAGIVHRAVNLSAGVRVDGAWHVQNVNAYHSRIKEWLRQFHGVASRYLSNYLGWRWAVDGGRIGTAEVLLRSALGAVPV